MLSLKLASMDFEHGLLDAWTNALCDLNALIDLSVALIEDRGEVAS